MPNPKRLTARGIPPTPYPLYLQVQARYKRPIYSGECVASIALRATTRGSGILYGMQTFLKAPLLADIRWSRSFLTVFEYPETNWHSRADQNETKGQGESVMDFKARWWGLTLECPQK